MSQKRQRPRSPPHHRCPRSKRRRLEHGAKIHCGVRSISTFSLRSSTTFHILPILSNPHCHSPEHCSLCSFNFRSPNFLNKKRRLHCQTFSTIKAKVFFCSTSLPSEFVPDTRIGNPMRVAF